MSHQPYLHALSSVHAQSAHASQKPLLEQALKQVGFVPNMYANMVNVPAAVLHAIRTRQPIADTRLSALHTQAVELVNTQGRPRTETVQAFLQSGFQEEHILWVILAVAVKTLSNFSNHAFGTVLDDRFAAHALIR